MRKQLTLFVCSVLMSLQIIGQQIPMEARCNCKSNAIFVYKHLTKSISYKKQKKNAVKATAEYQKLIEELRSDSMLTILDCYTKILKFTTQIEDNHNEVRTKAYPIEYQEFADSTSFFAFMESDHFNVYPFYTGDLMSLRESLEKKDIQELEGVYHYKNLITIGLIQEEENLNGYVLDSKLPNWRPGELIIRLFPKTNDRYQLILGHFINKSIISATDKFKDGYLMQQNWKKTKIEHPDHYKQPYPKRTYVLKDINQETQYLKIGSFSSSTNMIQKAKEFTDSIADLLISPHLILDLRGNTGGGRKNSKYLKALLQKFKGELFVLTNFRTKSQAERVTLMLSKKRKVTLMGDQTSGVIAYGRNYGGSKFSKDEWFSVAFTDMGGFQATQLENKGIDPEVPLKFNQDWIEQVVEYIRLQ